MSRIDWHRGKFNDAFEFSAIEDGIRAFQNTEIKDSVPYFRFDFQNSQVDDLYDEGVGIGMVFHPAVNVPCLHVTHNEGGNHMGDSGFYYNDDIYIVTSYDLFYRTGLTEADIYHQRYLKDRVIYDGIVFRLNQINILGQVDRRDATVSMSGTQVKPDEMVNDPQFAKYANVGEPQPLNMTVEIDGGSASTTNFVSVWDGGSA